MSNTIPASRLGLYALITVFIACCLLGTAGSVLALDTDKDLTQCRLDNWNTRDGLPPREIESIAQTPDGYLWLATRAGLARFDGAQFHVFDASNTPDWTRGMVRAVTVTPGGKIWVGTDGDGFGTFQDGHYTRYTLEPGTTPQWSETTALCAARDGSLWVGGQGDHSLLRLRHGRAETVSTAPWSVSGIVEDTQGAIWIATGAAGLHKINSQGLPMPREPKLPATHLTALCATRDGSLWVGTEHQGLWRLYDGKWRTYARKDGLVADSIRSLYADRAGNLWVGTRNGLHRWQNGRFHVFNSRNSLGASSIGPMLEDREGNLWVSAGAGLSRFSNTKLTPFELNTQPEAESGSLKGAVINGACQTRDGVCWFATSEGLARLAKGVVTTYSQHKGLPQSVNNSTVSSVWPAKDGGLWLITDGGGLHYWKEKRFTTLLPYSIMAKVAEDRDGLVLEDWNTLSRLRNGKPVSMSCDKPLGYIFTFCLAPDGTLWFGCEQGLGHVRGDKIELFSQKEGLPENTHVLAVACANSKEQWIGTDKGLARFRDGKFTLFSKQDGLPDDNLYQVLIADNGSLWIGGNRGIFVVSRNSLEAYEKRIIPRLAFRLYEAPDGIRRFPLAQTALKTSDGKLWFRGDTGLTIVDPAHLRSNALVPAVIIEQVVLDGVTIDAARTARVSLGKGELTARYTAPSLTMPERVRFRYKLEGYDPKWIEADARRAAYYTNLPPGTYCFRVMACNNDGVWNSAGAAFTFTLEPRFYQTGWFRLAMLLALVVGLLALVRARLRSLHHANRLLEQRIASRTEQLVRANHELKTSHEEVEAANVRLQALATTDGMTMLANHRRFQERLREAVETAQVTGQSMTMLLADVDHFKQYNDSYGHPAGDEVLRIVARLLRENTRPGDCVARYGGEEFAILLPATDVATALEVAERLRDSISAYAFPCRRVTVSIGVALPNENEFCPAALVTSADQALYAAKRAGRNRVLLASKYSMPPCAEREPEPAQVVADAAAALDTQFGQSIATAWEIGGAAQTLTGVLALLNLRDPETDGHCQRVARYVLRLAQELIRQGVIPLSPDELRDLTLGALLHDIGKIGVPDSILYKPGALNEAEWEVMRRHPEQGAEILQVFSAFVNALPVVRSHHERWDGRGYPDGLAEMQIPLAARLFAIADTFDAMSSDRPYRAALPFETIRQEIAQMAGSQYDPALVEVFLTIPKEAWEELMASESEPMELQFAPSEADTPIALPRAA